MSLHGTLETFALPDVLTLIASTHKTGELRVSGPQLQGSVWLDAGLVVEAAVGSAATFVDAVFDLLRLSEGTFTFDAGGVAPHPGVPAPVEPLLEETRSRLEEWTSIAKVIPTLEHAVELVPKVTAAVTLRHEQWPLVVALGAHRTPRGVLEALGVSEFSGCKALKELVDAGLVRVGDPVLVPRAAAGQEGASKGAPSTPGVAPATPEGAKDAATVAPSLVETPGLESMDAALPAAAAAAPSRAGSDPAMAAALARQLAGVTDSAQPAAGRNGQAAASAARGPEMAQAGNGAAKAGASGRPRGQADVPGAVAAQAAGGPAASGNGNGGPAAVDRLRPGGRPGQAGAAKGPGSPAATQSPRDASAPAPSGAAATADAAAVPGGEAAPDQAATEEPAPPAEAAHGDEPINRGLLLKFLSSVRS